MLTIITALYCEAQPIIQQYHLKKDNSITKFQVFENETIRLIITDTGSIHAAVGVTYLSTCYPPGSSDFLINIGVCAAADSSIYTGSIFLCNKIVEETSGRSFYPDLLLKHPFVESSIGTCSNVWHASESASNMEQSRLQSDTGYDEQMNGMKVKLYDMEAAGIYQACTYFYQPHQVSFIKIVSDYGTEDKLSPQKITELVENSMPGIAAWLQQLEQAEFKDDPLFTLEEETCMKNMAEHFHCTVTMEHQLKQQLQYYKLIHGSFLDMADDFCKHVQLPCKTKAEGKKCFEQFKERLI